MTDTRPPAALPLPPEGVESPGKPEATQELSPETESSSSAEEIAGDPEAHDAPAAPAGPPTAGGLIRAARQEQGIDLASLAAMLKIPLRKLEALEQGRHGDLPGQAFERALAQSACRVLKIDPKPVLALMPHVGSNTLEHVGGGINTPFREPHARGEHVVDAQTIFRPVVLLPVLLAIAALVLFYAPASLWPHLSRQSGGEAEAPSAAASGGTSTATIAPPSVQTAPAAPSAAPAAAVAASAIAPAPVAAEPASVAASTGVDEVAEHTQAPPAIPVQVTAAEDSWIEVVDAKGHTLLSRTVVAGESVGLDGPLPMRVKIGNAHGTRLTLRGENVDLNPWTRDNVARLELK
jgi:cytoskeleton protein RodZ